MADIFSIIDNKLGDMDNTDLKWVRFVKDHRSLIEANSFRIILGPNLAAQNEYRLDRYLSEVRRIDRQFHWIVFLINNWSGNMDFINTGSVLIPDIDYIKTLYQSYQSTEKLINE